MIWLAWSLATVLYVLGGIAMILPALEMPILKRWRGRFILAFWPGFVVWALAGTLLGRR